MSSLQRGTSPTVEAESGDGAARANFRQQTLHAASWSVAGQIALQALRFGLGIVVARLLTPRDFGLMGMITVITGFAALFAELGFGAALVQKRDVTEEHLSTVFWVNVGGGATLGLLVFLSAPALARFYREPMLEPLTALVSLTFFIRSLNIVQQTLLTKRLAFRAKAIVDSLAALLGGGIAIGMAVGGFGVYCLAAEALVTASVTTLGFWFSSPWRPRWMLDTRALRDLSRFSLHLLGTNSLNYWARNVDNLLIGRVLGSAPLGIYARAYSVMMFPLTNVSNVLLRVMFPAFSMIQQEPARVAKAYLRMSRAVALVTFPLCTGVALTAEPFVVSLFGPRWMAVIPVLRVLTLAGMIQSIGTLNGSLYMSQGRADLQFRVSIFAKLVTIAALVAGVPFGVLGVAIGCLVGTLLITGPTFYFAGRLVGLGWSDQAKNLSGIYGVTAVMALGVLGTSWVLPPLRPAIELLIEATVGAVLYVALVFAFKVQAASDILAVVRGRRERATTKKGSVAPKTPSALVD
jgi:O-antigen/teichoic acid export membrane protein